MDGETGNRQTDQGQYQHGNRQKTDKEVRTLAKPLLDIHCVNEPYCNYPTAIKVAMDDGTIQTYELKNKMEYKFGEVMKCIAKMETGYQYRGRHQKSRTHRSEL